MNAEPVKTIMGRPGGGDVSCPVLFLLLASATLGTAMSYMEGAADALLSSSSSSVSSNGSGTELTELRPTESVVRERRAPPPGIGSLMPLTEAGYRRVASRRSDEEMQAFIRRVLRQQGLDVVDETGLSSFAKFFSGTSAVQSLAALKVDLFGAPWAAQRSHAELDQDVSHNFASPVDNASFQRAVQHGTEEEVQWLVRRMLAQEQRQVQRKQEFKHFVRMLKSSQGDTNLDAVHQALQNATWATAARNDLSTSVKNDADKHHVSPRAAPVRVESESQSDDEFVIGNAAPLTEDGYQQVAAAANDEEMKRYARRVVAATGGDIIDEGALSGLVGYYSGTKSVQSLSALQSELESASWVQHITLMPSQLALLHTGAQVASHLGASAAVIEDDGSVAIGDKSPLILPNVVAPAEASLKQVQDVAQQMRVKAVATYAEKKQQLDAIRNRYETNLHSMNHRNAEMRAALASLQSNISGVDQENRMTTQEALSVQAQNHARLQVVHTLKRRLEVAMSFLHEDVLRNISDSLAELGNSSAEHLNLEDFMGAARRELFQSTAGMEASTTFEREGTVLLQTSERQIVKPNAADLKDASGAMHEAGDNANVAREMVQRLSSNIDDLNKATVQARQKLEANYEASAKHYIHVHEDLGHSMQQLLQSQQTALNQGARLRAARGFLKGVSARIDDRLSSLGTFMRRISAVADRAAALAAESLEAAK